jgi:N-acetylmuramic acid 6-phosphate (MurNAc-6-P) etherase
MEFNLKELFFAMVEAAKGELGEMWPEISSYVEEEMRAVAVRIIAIRDLQQQGKITNEKAKMLLELQADNSKVILVTAGGLSRLRAEELIQAVFGAVQQAVNKALGWTLILF